MSDQPTLAECRERVEELRRRDGDEHPLTLAAMLDLAEMLWARGRLAEVRALEEHVVAVRRRVLGEGHGDTLKALGKLATTIGAEGDLDEARRLQEHIVRRGPMRGARPGATRCARSTTWPAPSPRKAISPAPAPSSTSRSRRCSASSAKPIPTR